MLTTSKHRPAGRTAVLLLQALRATVQSPTNFASLLHHDMGIREGAHTQVPLSTDSTATLHVISNRALSSRMKHIASSLRHALLLWTQWRRKNQHPKWYKSPCNCISPTSAPSVWMTFVFASSSTTWTRGKNNSVIYICVHVCCVWLSVCSCVNRYFKHFQSFETAFCILDDRKSCENFKNLRMWLFGLFITRTHNISIVIYLSTKYCIWLMLQFPHERVFTSMYHIWCFLLRQFWFFTMKEQDNSIKAVLVCYHEGTR